MGDGVTLSILSITISLIFAIVGVFFSLRSAENLKSMDEKINLLNEKFIPILDQSMAGHLEITKDLIRQGSSGTDSGDMKISERFDSEGEAPSVFAQKREPEIPSIKVEARKFVDS